MIINLDLLYEMDLKKNKIERQLLSLTLFG